MSENLRVKSSEFIDETNKVSFKFNGKTYYGFKGDTLASALLANDVHLIARSFKYHRPRGIMSAGSEEPNAIVQVNANTDITEPNVRATEVEIYEGLEASSQNCWPNVNFDIGAINNVISPFIPAGFYYKTFMWPPKFWEKYEFFIRHSAGLGKSPTKKDFDYLENLFDVNKVKESVSFLSPEKEFINHLNLYNKIDIALDTFPWNGVTTSFESIWMGVPVLTLKGYNFNSRCRS